MRTIVALIQIIVAMLAILALVLWEKRDRNTNWTIIVMFINSYVISSSNL